MDEEKTIDTYDPQKVYESLMRWIGDLPVGARRMAEPHARRLLEMAEGKFQEWGKYRTPDLTGIADRRNEEAAASSDWNNPSNDIRADLMRAMEKYNQPDDPGMRELLIGLKLFEGYVKFLAAGGTMLQENNEWDRSTIVTLRMGEHYKEVAFSGRELVLARGLNEEIAIPLLEAMAELQSTAKTP